MSYEQCLESAVLYADANRGVYIPKYFIESIDPDVLYNVRENQKDILLAGPDHEYYWDTWDDVLNNAYILEKGSCKQYELYQDGDLWLVPVHKMGVAK